MKLTDIQPAVHYKIGSPRWNGNANERQVGLAVWMMGKDNTIEFTYERKTGPTKGERSIPGTFYFDGNLRYQHNYRKMMVGQVELLMIPFTDLERLDDV